MALVRNVNSRSYSVGEYPLAITVQANLREFIVRLTCNTWPVGKVGRLNVLWSDGKGGGFDLIGGQRNRQNQLMQYVYLHISKPIGVTAGDVVLTVNSTFTSGVRVDSK